MKIAEALARRRDLTNSLAQEFTERAIDRLTYEDGEERNQEDARAVFSELYESLLEVQRLSVRINLTNNAHVFQWDGADISLMQAIAARDTLARKIAALRALIGEIETAIGSGKRSYYNRRSKDDVRIHPVIPLSEIRKQLDGDQASLRRLDTEIQKANWSLDLLG